METQQGKIDIRVKEKSNQVIVDFKGAAVHWVKLTGNQAIDLGKLLIKYGKLANVGK